MVKKLVIGAILLAVVAAIVWVASGQPRLSVSGEVQVTPTVLPAVQASDQVIADGRVVPVQSADLNLPTGGIVAKVLVEEGESVKAGQPLLQLESARQEATVAQAKAGVAQARAGVEQAEAGVTQAEAGVSRATARLEELRVGARPQEVAAAQASLDSAQAQLARVTQGARAEDIQAAQANVAAAQASLRQAQQGATEQQLIAARAELANAEAAVQVAQAAYDRVKGNADIGMRPESLQLQQATNNYNAAKARYDDLARGGTESAVSAAQAQVQQAQASLNALRAGARPAEISAAQAEIRRVQAQLELIQAGTRPETIAASEADVASAAA
ncbi:MAG: biotin/lipoyl-binding protein, partial [Ardenticatenales bacterium]|nr:biotin/lipoyl-binding protein [Ardenticatenales bacterium]